MVIKEIPHGKILIKLDTYSSISAGGLFIPGAQRYKRQMGVIELVGDEENKHLLGKRILFNLYNGKRIDDRLLSIDCQDVWAILDIDDQGTVTPTPMDEYLFITPITIMATQSGVISGLQLNNREGIVLALGEKVRIPFVCQGAKVIIDKQTGLELDINDQEMLLIHRDDVLGVYVDE